MSNGTRSRGRQSGNSQNSQNGNTRKIGLQTALLVFTAATSAFAAVVPLVVASDDSRALAETEQRLVYADIFNYGTDLVNTVGEMREAQKPIIGPGDWPASWDESFAEYSKAYATAFIIADPTLREDLDLLNGSLRRLNKTRTIETLAPSDLSTQASDNLSAYRLAVQEELDLKYDFS